MKATSEFCYQLDGSGRAKPVPFKSVPRYPKKPVWIHLDYTKPDTQKWLKGLKLSRTILENLLDSDTTPRFFTYNKGVMLVLRGINKISDDDGMIALHMCVEKNLLLTLSHRAMPSLADVLDTFKHKDGPKTISECLVAIARHMTNRIEDALVAINNEGDELEDAVLSEVNFARDSDLRSRLAVLRHEIISLRRHLLPEREMMAKMIIATKPYFSDSNQGELEEIARDMAAIVSELDYARDHATVIQEELDSQTNINISRIMYLMSLVMVIFTPLTFFTGLLGANVGGIPFGEHPNGFAIICGLLVICVVVQIWLIRKLKWF
ncbi:MAG: hypothetical protein J6Y85_02765 [Alphaproteobacteria bacterium]|nr:hypothetical protein [Alphaproteobacteria bacterium]